MVKKLKPQTVTNVVDMNKDYHNRMRNYSLIMGFRFLCIALTLLIPLPLNIIPLLIAVFSPWFAVIIANNKKPTKADTVEKPVLELK